MKRVLSLFLSCIFVLGVCFSTPVIASAVEPETFVVDGNVFQYEENNECSIKKWGDTEVESLDVPDTVYDGDVPYTITGILSGAFSGCEKLESITIKSNVTVVEDGAFNESSVKYVFLKNDNTQVAGNPEGVVIHNSSCMPLDVDVEGAYIVSDSTITWYCTCGENSTKIPCGEIALVGEDLVVYDGELHEVEPKVVGVNGLDEIPAVSYGVDEESNQITPINAGTYTATFTVSENVKVTKEFTIEPKVIDVNLGFGGEQPDSLVYNGNEHILVVDFGEEILYVDDDYTIEYVNNKNAGEIIATVRLTEGGNYAFLDGETLTYSKTINSGINIEKVTPEVTIVKAENLVFTNEEQPLLTTANTTFGTFKFSLEDTEDETKWSTAIPTTSAAGPHTVYYKVVGDSNVEDLETQSVTVTISEHKHSWSYEANEAADTITAICSGAGLCGAENNSVTIKLNAPQLPEGATALVYDGTAKEATISGIPENFGIDATINYTGNLIENECVNAGSYTASITLGDATVSVEFTIEKAPSKLVLVPEINEGLEYSGDFQSLINEDKAGKAEGGVINYKVNDGDWSTEVPSYTAPGTYNVYYKVVGDANHNDTVEEVRSVTIAPKTIDVKALADIEYTGENHDAPEIVFDGTIEGVDVEYSATYMRGEKEETDFKDVGVITVTVKLESEVYIFEDDTISKKLTFEIKKAAASVAIAPTANKLTYDGKEHALITAGSATGGTMQYKLGEAGEWSTNIPTGTDAGTYTVYYKVVGDANHSDSAEASISVTIGKAPVTLSVETQERVYDGTTAVEIKSATVSGVVTGEIVTVNFSGVTATSAGSVVGTHEVDFEGDFQLVGDAANNYKIGAISEISVKITAKPLTITAKDKTVVINSGISEFEYKVEGLVDDDTITTVTLTPAVDNTATVGEYTLTPSAAVIKKGDTDVTSNYTITYVNGKFTITACTKHEWKNSKCTICKIDCEHKYEDGKSAISNKVTTPATCVKEGVLLSQCKICDYKLESPLDIDLINGHKMSDWTETVKATCSSTGVEERTCENGDCKHTETRETEKNPNNHTYGDWVVTAATCVADGEKVKTCTNTECKHELKETIAKDPTAHKMAAEWEVTKAPTCVETGLQVKTCLNVGCDHEIKEVIAIKADAHNLGGWVVTKAAKCTVAGEITRFCKNGNCEYKVTDSLDPDGKTHDFAKDFTVIEATCISTGSKFRACENEGCKEVTEKTEIAIDPDAHKNVETINVKQPTCEEKGYTGDEHCNDCKKTFDPGIEVDALGHTESDWIVDKEATFTEEGARHTVCKVCSKELKKEVIAKLTLATPSPKAYNKTSSIKVKWTDVDNALTYNVYRSDFVNNDWTKWKKIGSVKQGVGEFSDKNVVAGKQYKYTVKAYNGEFKSSIKTSNKLTFIAPVKPALTITTTGIILKWDTVLGADKYVVYRSQLVDGKWSDWKKVSTVKDGKTSAVDTSVESGATYKYSVRAYIGSSYTERKASGTIIYLAQPTIKLSNTATGIKGSWKTVNGATGYVITRAEYNENTKKFGTAIKLGTAGATAKSFTDKTAKEGVKYKYTLTAINGTYSSVVSSGKVIRRLGEPVVTIENANGSIKGKWTQVKGATNYTVYRSELVDGKWTSWKNLGTTGATAKSFTDKTVKSGVNYKYTVKAINGGSKSSVGASNKVVYLSRPEPKAVNSIYGVKVTWGAITGAESYIVYRKAYVNKKWTEWQQIGTAETNSYIDSTATSGVKYKYTIHAVSGESLSARKATSTLLHVATPTATVKATEKAINVSWGQVGGATKYVVYRQVLGADGKWSASTKIASLKGVLEFTDTTAEAGNTYRYKVVAYNGKVKSSSNATDGILLPTAQ